MSLEKAVRALAGIMILISVALTIWLSPHFVWLTLFVGANLLQSSFTGLCPAARVLRLLGFRPDADRAGD